MADDPIEPLHSRLREAIDRNVRIYDNEGELLEPLDDALTELRGHPRHPFRERASGTDDCGKCGQTRLYRSHLTDAGIPVEAVAPQRPQSGDTGGEAR